MSCRSRSNKDAARGFSKIAAILASRRILPPNVSLASSDTQVLGEIRRDEFQPMSRGHFFEPKFSFSLILRVNLVD